MKVLAFIPICFVLTLGFAYAQQDSRVRLRLGEHTTLRVGNLAELKINHSRKYHVTLEGDAIVPLYASSQERGSHAYRAVHPGNATLLITPTDSKEGDCIDCVTRHCFITVVPSLTEFAPDLSKRQSSELELERERTRTQSYDISR